jgi:hypothetical protein
MASFKLPSIPKMSAPRQAKTPPIKGPEFQKAVEVSGIEQPRKIFRPPKQAATPAPHWSNH